MQELRSGIAAATTHALISSSNTGQSATGAPCAAVAYTAWEILERGIPSAGRFPPQTGPCTQNPSSSIYVRVCGFGMRRPGGPDAYVLAHPLLPACFTA